MKNLNYNSIILILFTLYSRGTNAKEKFNTQNLRVTLKCIYPGYTSPGFGPDRAPNFLIDSSSIKLLSLVSNELMVDFKTDSIDLLLLEKIDSVPFVINII